MAALRALLLAAALAPAAGGTSFGVDLCARSGGGYFDTAALACSSCGTAAENVSPTNRSTDALGNAAGCACRAGYAAGPAPVACDQSSFGTCPADVCSPCGPGNVSSLLDPTRCLPCDPATTLGVVGTDCACFSAAAGSGAAALVEAGPGGARLGAKACAPCPPRARVFAVATPRRRADLYRCQACADPAASMSSTGDCVCDAGYVAAGLPDLAPDGGVACLPTASVSAITTVAGFSEAAAAVASFTSLQTGPGGASNSAVTKTSVWYKHLYLPAAVACARLQPTSPTAPCHTLANLCVLALYAPTAPPCALYNAILAARRGSINGFPGWPRTLPFLRYNVNVKAVLQDTALSRVMSFDATKEAGTSDTMQFVLVKYALNGTLLGMDRLTNQLSYCGGGSGGGAEDPKWLRFGYGTTSVATCNLRGLAAGGEPVFYDLYVRDLAADVGSPPPSGTAAGLPITLFPVPVRLVNYRSETGASPNANTGFSDEADDVLTRRFTLFDAVSGVTTAGQPPEVLRYATSVVLRINARRSGANARPNLLGPPELTITYRERLTAGMGVSGDASYARDVLSFSVEYVSDNSEVGTGVLAVAVSYGVLVTMWAISRVVSWTRLNARNEFEAALGLATLGRLLLELLLAFARSFFWFLWAVTLYWLIFFKLQTAVYILLPPMRPEYTDNAYTAFAGGLISVFVAYAIRILILLRKQVTADIFFVDWETPRGAIVRLGGAHEAALAAANAQVAPSNAYGGTVAAGAAAPGGAGAGSRFAPISMWRTIHAANEWAELATDRRVSLPFTLLILVAVLQGGGLQYIATQQPSRWDLTPGPINPVLQFANTVFWFWIIVLCQLTYVLVLGERYVDENPTTRFIDVCTVSKISVLLMDAKYHGYYLHACAPHEHADGDMAELAGHLAEEAAAMRTGRGLPGCPDPTVQTFELHVPALWREQYDRVYRHLLAVESDAVDGLVRDMNTARMGGGGPGGAAVGGAYGGQPPGGGYGGAGGGWGGGAGAGPGPGSSPLTSLSAVSGVAKLKAKTVRLHASFMALNAFLRSFIDETDPDFKRAWRERSLVQSLFDLPPDLLSEALMARSQGAGAASRTTLIVPDGGYRFEALLYRGIEADLLTWDVLLFCLVDYALPNPILSALVTWIVDTAIAQARQVLGRRNMAYKTLIDSRFLK